MYVLKHKSEVFQWFREWKALVEKSTGRKVKVLSCDNAGEFAAYLIQEGIKQELTTHHTPQLNGTTEKLNRMLIKGVRIMLADLKLPYRFWAEALSMCVYL